MNIFNHPTINHSVNCVQSYTQICTSVTKRRPLSVQLMPAVATGKLDSTVCPITRDTPRRLARSTNAQFVPHHATDTRPRKFALVALHWTLKPTLHTPRTTYRSIVCRQFSCLLQRRWIYTGLRVQVLKPYTPFRPSVLPEMILVDNLVHLFVRFATHPLVIATFRCLYLLCLYKHLSTLTKNNRFRI